MCYDVAAGTQSALKYAKHRGDDPEIIAELERQLQLWIQASTPYHAISGFAHPHLLVFTNDEPYTPQVMQWGLIPSWAKDISVAGTIMNQTLNARAETMFEKPSFKQSALKKRCLVYLDAFYEHHHFNKKVYPFHIAMKDGSPMVMAGLWDEWLDKETGEMIRTVSIVTTKAIGIMEKIHNNPKLTEGRVPVILLKSNQNEWLKKIHGEHDITSLMNLCHPISDDLLSFYTVPKLKGKESPGNVLEAEIEFRYTELNIETLMELS